ncbi:MAG: alpha-ketoglutarate-dependent dioxygenase AlkB [Deltaproteobacteria bacterium]|nr:alpha-ketoglutarate-dependent dioxygenase AlkB [Deltaproteobacteria bacterium]
MEPLIRTELAGGFAFYTGRLPPELVPSRAQFDELWALHPDDFHEIKMHGRLVKTPRWQQAYGEDYAYTGRVNRALSIPPLLAPLHAWCRETLDARLNGLLLNWYDAADGHYIGKHRDSTRDMVEGAPIITVSFGAARTFRLRPWRGAGFVDVATFDGAVFAMPYDTNKAFTHEVPHHAAVSGRRISVTLRAFVED